MNIFGHRIIESPLVPKATKFVPPSLIQQQTGNILFRLFCKPPESTTREHHQVIVLNGSVTGGSGKVFLVDPLTMASLKKSMRQESETSLSEDMNFMRSVLGQPADIAPKQKIHRSHFFNPILGIRYGSNIS